MYLYVGDYYGEVEEVEEVAEPVAIVARYNVNLFAQLVHICDTKPDARLGFPGGLQKSQLPILEDIYRLDKGKREDIQDKTIRQYETYEGLKEFALKAEDLELRARIKVCSLFSQVTFEALLFLCSWRYMKGLRARSCHI